MKLLVLFIAVLISVSLADEHRLWNKSCPDPEKIEPKCSCKLTPLGPEMECSKITNADELDVTFKAIKNHYLYSLTLVECTLMYIPDGIFIDTNIQTIHLHRNQIMSLAETDYAFKGLEDSLEYINVIRDTFGTDWSWSALSNLKKLGYLDIEQVSLDSISEPFPSLNLTSLSIQSAAISYIVPQAFQALENLKRLILSFDGISELSRDMFPDPAKLHSLDLSGNKLKFLPDNFFDRMPDLTVVHLELNDFTTINEKTFSAVMGRVNEFHFEGNKLECDCRLRWILGSRTPWFFNVMCYHPINLNGKYVTQLEEKALLC